MLATAEQVKKATELSVEEVRAALKNAGYGDEEKEITEVRFKGFTGTGFMYEITFLNPEDEGMMTGNIFITLKRRPFSSTFEFYAEF